jgi:glycogen synthase
MELIQGILITVAFTYTLILGTNGLKNYVTSNETAQCSDGWSNCLILEKYASQPDDYFKNNTIFQFESGSHRLNKGLTFTNLHNFTLLG